MKKKLYPLPSYYGCDDLGEDVFCCFLAWFDDSVDGFPVEQEPGESVFYGSYDECCDFLDINSSKDW